MKRFALLCMALLCVACRDPRPDRARAAGLGAIERIDRAGGRLVFVSERDGDREIYAVDPDGRRLERLTRRPGADYPAPPGPSGELLAIASAGDGVERLSLRHGGRWHPFGPASRFVRNPSWSPSGAVVVESDRGSFRDLHRLDLSGGEEQLTRSKTGAFEPAVAPDGTRVAYVSSDEGDPEIYLLDLRTRAIARLTWSRGEDSAPSWSPDGRLLAFVSGRRGGARAYLMEADGARPRPLTTANESEHGELAWSPDGRAIALVARLAGRSRIQVVRAADGAILGQSDGRARDEQPSWSPCGRFVAFSSDRDGDRDIYVMRADGSQRRRITSHRADDWLPRWVNVGKAPTLASVTAGSFDPR